MLGFLSPYKVQGEVLLQEIWMNGLALDYFLLLNISKSITNWLKGLETLSRFQVPICLQCPVHVSEVKFHVFNDVSEKAYMGVLFIKDPFTNQARSQQIWLCQCQNVHHCRHHFMQSCTTACTQNLHY